MPRNAADAIAIKCCGEFTPPIGCVRQISSSLKWISPEDLEGIGSIFLFDRMPSLTPGRNPDLERSIQDNLLLFASYNAKTANESAHIILVLPNLYKPIPRLFRLSSALTLWFTENIAHEVAHHVIAEKRFSIRVMRQGARAENEEEFAERYASSLVAKMKSANRLANLLLNIAAGVNYYRGVYFWKRRKYEAAAESFYLATQLKRDHRKASYWFWKAEEKKRIRTNEST